MTVKYTWSYSGISLFKQCPQKYYRMKIVKDIVEPQHDHLTYGLEVHKVAEDYIRDGTPIPAKYGFIQEQLDKLVAINGDKHCELKMGLTREFEPCDFDAKDVWWRGIADLIIIDGDKAFLVDYKTGKSAKYADTGQLELLALAIFKHFPEVKKVKAGLLFVVSKEFIKAEYSNEDGKRWVRWLQDTHRLETAMLTKVWNANPNFTCRNHCPVLDCLHNGKNA